MKRQKHKLGKFCNGTCFVKEIIIKDIKKYKIYLSHPHSEAFSKLKQNKIDNSEVILDDYTQFKKDAYEYLNN